MFLFEKLISLSIFSPLPVILVLIFTGISMSKKKDKKGSLLIFIGIFIYFITADFFIDRALYSIENKYHPISEEQLKQGDIYVLLGGGIFPDTAGGDVPTPNASDRILKTAQYYKKFPKKIIISGGVPLHNKISESEIYKNYLIDLGVSPDDIITEEKSRTTQENAQFIKEKLENEYINSLILITSSSHMKRSLNIFEYYMKNIEVFPAPCNYLASDYDNKIFSFIPKYHNFLKFQIFIWETVGNIYYKLKY
ncbi:YdcF family protein [Fusobacterium sp.]|uniref:YdcF family protein n=1 Tax=Fusobacterium sp. TaxID=68766 RepID=UPI00396CFFDA